MEDTYRKSKGNAGLEGVQFQLYLLAVFLLNALRSRKNWKMSTENKEAGKFDDLVLDFDDKCVLLQAKFKQSKKITREQLFSCNSKNADFSLPKYFFSYLEVKSDSVEKVVIVCTNTDIDGKGLENCLKRHCVSASSMLHYEGNFCPFYTFNENILPELKASAEVYFHKNLRDKSIDKAAMTEENMKDFLNHFQCFSNYPSGDQLDKVIEQLLLRLNNSGLYRKVSSQELYKKVENWFKQPKGEYLTEERAKAMFSEIKSDKYCEELKSYNVSFRQNSFNFTDPERIFQVHSEGRHLLQALKVYDALHKDKGKKLYVNPNDDMEVQKHVINAFVLPRYTFLIIIGVKFTQDTAIKEISSTLKDILKKYSYKKVILVAEHNNKLSRQFGLNDIFQVGGSVTLKNLSGECQDRLVEQNNIIFQGEQISLEELLETQTKEDWRNAINYEVLEMLIRKKEIKVGEPLSDLDESNSRFYIARTFKTQIFKSNAGQGSCELQQAKPHLNEYGCNTNKAKEGTFPEMSAHDVNQEVILISDGAGTGKSTVLTKMATAIKEKNPHLWVIKIELTRYSSFLRDVLANRRETVSVMDLLNSKNATKMTNHLEKFAFSSSKKVVLMLDGIDEISPDYTGLVLSMLTQCLQAANFAKLFITTRPHMVRELEAILKVKPFVMQPFTEQDQIDFLISYWVYNLAINDDSRGKCDRYARALISRVSSWTKGYYVEDDFTAIPLQLKMLAEIFQESIKQNKTSDWEGCKEFLKETREKPKLPEKMEIKELYDMFIEKKRDIYIYKGNPSGNSAANMALIDQFDESLKYHRRLALEVILHKEDRQLFSCYQQSCKDINESILKIGIVQRPNDEPQFIHRTFAEYFVAESLVHELQVQLHSPDIKFQEFFVGKVLQLPENVIIRGFLDNFLSRVVDSVPANILEKYESHTCDQCCWMDYHRFIHLLAEEGCLAILRLILKCVNFEIVRGKEINIEDLTSHDLDNNRSVSQALIRKIRVNRREKKENILLFTRLITQEAGINIRDGFGSTLLYYAADGGHFEMVRFLTEQGADINSAGFMRSTALHCAASNGHLDIVEYLVKSNHDIDIQNVNRRTALHFAAARGHLDTVKLLHRLGADLNVTDFDGGTALHCAVSGHHLDTVKYLLELGADFDVENMYHRTPLHLAAIYGFSDMVKFLFGLGADLGVRDYEGNTASHLTAFFGRLEAIRILHELGANLNIRDYDGRTPLHLAAREGHLATVEFFVKHNFDVSIKDDKGRTPLHLAAAEGQLTVVKFLVNVVDDVNIRDNDGRTPLHLAAWAGHLDTVEFLHGLGTDTNVRDNDDSTPLHLAAARGQLTVVKFLVNLVGDVNIRDINARTPLHLAAWAGHLNTVEFLHGLGTDINVRDNDDSTPLHLAAARGQLTVVKFLVNLVGDVNIRDVNARTPLHLAAWAGHLNTVEFLHGLCTDLNVRDNDDSTPLHLATVSGHLGAVKFLLKVGADLGIRNKDGRTPLQLARYKGHRQIVNYFKNRNRTTLKVGMGIRKKK